MKAAYKWLAFIIAAEVVVQAAAIAFGYARLGKYVDDGATLTKDTDSFPGATALAGPVTITARVSGSDVVGTTRVLVQ